MNQFPLSGKVALVTGASRGIGREIALGLARAGAFVTVNCARGVDKAEAVVAEIEAMKRDGTAPASSGGMVRQFSVADSAAVDAAVDSILREKGAIHILVNNAGIARDSLLMRMKDEEWDETLNTNLKGAALCARAVARPMMKAREGVIVNVSSVVGQMGNAGQAAYSASKAGLFGLTKSLAKELASRNIRVNAIAPGFIDTEMTENLPETAKGEMLKAIPLGRMGQSREVADAVAWLASPQASYITGQVIAINGGMYV
ncbi:MAG: 3-oxoacyl-[acyl-carrier-protein] reductase [Bdellovibrionales bacterium]|nr:3-oxoacyl-[acyl-carrier-protein] reductase [Bdellovibrionales bacterium]